MGWEELRQGPLESRCSCFSACTYRVFLVLVRKARVSTACPGLHQRWPRAEAFLGGDFSSVGCARALVLLQSSLLITGASTTSHPSGTFSVHPHCCPHHLPFPNPQRPPGTQTPFLPIYFSQALNAPPTFHRFTAMAVHREWEGLKASSGHSQFLSCP